MTRPPSSIRFASPLIHEIRGKGYTPVDMHIHTRHSDGAIRIPSLLARARHLGIGVAITDHHEIGGVIEALDHPCDVLVIPGIELASLEGAHILLYFYSPGDLADYFATWIRGDRKKGQFMAPQLPVQQILETAAEYRCVKVAAHPFGYFGINRGVLKCIDRKTLPPGILRHIDGIEVICGAMGQDLNEKAAGYASEHVLPITGGSDAHTLPSVGGVVTGVRAGTVRGFLDGILSRKCIVIGSTASPLHRGMNAGVIAWTFLPSAVSSLQVSYEESIPRLKQYLGNLLK
ncbi:MAG TPA: PHP-associated domain-containing protein [Methanomicrobiales archaeon]|nr:PHP-associated domain-containing protein [Methanomicrobiales archaeon]